MMRAISMMLLHQPRAIVMPGFDGRVASYAREVLVGFWTFRGARPWPAPAADNDDAREAAAS